MTITINIADEDLKELVVSRLADKALDELLEPEHLELGWDERKKYKNKILSKITSTIDWKNAGNHLSEVVVKKFFEKYIGDKERDS